MKVLAILFTVFMFSISSFAQLGNTGAKVSQYKINSNTNSLKVKAKQQNPVQTHHKPHTTNAVDRHDKYANQEVSYAIKKNKIKTVVKPVRTSKKSKTKLMGRKRVFFTGEDIRLL